MVISNFLQAGNSQSSEELHINLRKRSITATMNAFKFIDKDTKQHVIYLPSFELSGYGDTFEKAQEMLKFSVDNLFDFLINLSASEMQIELSRLGWKKSVFNKDYSWVNADIHGELRSLNAVDDKVEQITLTAA